MSSLLVLDRIALESLFLSNVVRPIFDRAVPRFLNLELLRLLLRGGERSFSFSKVILEQYKNVSDGELVRMIYDNNQDAFEFVYRTYAKMLYAYARRTISLKEDCEEIVHDLFVDLWHRRHRLLHVTHLKPYLIQSVRFKVIRYVQHSQVKQRYHDHFKAFEATYESPTAAAEEDVDLRTIILDGISDLPKRCQVVIELRLENLSNEEIAKKMNIKKRTVENYIVTARDHLRKKDILRLRNAF